ncbi:hypothetical protein IGI37_002228 [Enterococcus sp. AZ194]|uniref:ATP-binding cassette domain-containing protein n=1 Tax=Enterococcus sp. AZ194 TaxID=2774629 RepID=UPI003F225BF2
MVKTTLFLLKEYWKVQPSRLIFSISLKVIEALMLTINSIGLLYFLTSSYEQNRPFRQVTFILVLFGGIQLLISSFSSWYATVIQENQILKSREYFSKKMVDSVINIDYSRLFTPQFYDEFNLVSQGVNKYFELAYTNVLNGLFQLVALINAIVVTISIDPRLLVLSVFLFLSMYFAKKLNQTTFEKEKRLVNIERRKTELQALLLTKEANVDFKTTGLDACFHNFVQQMYDENIALTKSYAKKQILFKMVLTDFSINFIYLFSLFFAVYSFVAFPSFTISQFSILFSAIILFLTRIRNLLQTIENADAYRLYIRAFQRFTSLKIQKKPTLSAIEELSLYQVNYNYPKTEKQVLKNISLSLRKGEKIAIVGPNGSGKSTLLKIFSGILNDFRGEIMINREIDSKKVEWDQHLTFLSQDFLLFNVTLLENIIGSSEKSTTMEALSKEEWFQPLSKKMNQRLGKELFEDGLILSGGEAQKIALARALCKEPSILLMDEPTSALDNISAEQVMHSISQKIETVVYVTHNPQVAMKADRILLMQEGQLIYDGPPNKILENDIYKNLFESSMKEGME